jgi:hypothetical protein
MIRTSRCTGSRLSYFRKAGRAFGIVPKGSLRENPCDTSQRTCRRKRRTQASRFLSARIAPFARRRRFRSHHLSNCWVTSKSLGARGEGFNRRVTISVLRFDGPDLTPLGTPKLSACAAGIESERYDLDRFLLSQRSTTRLVELINMTLSDPSIVRRCRDRLPPPLALRAFPSSMRRGPRGGA